MDSMGGAPRGPAWRRPVWESHVDHTMKTDRRRAARLQTKLWVGIPEVDGEPELERCDISGTGLLLQTRRDAGVPGVVRMLRLVNADQDEALEIMAHVVRVIACDDVVKGRVIEATAFEFLPHGDEHRRELERFLRRLAEAELMSTRDALVGFSVPAQLTDLPGAAQPATVSALGVSGMVIETSWAIEVGEQVRAEIQTPASGRAVRLSGKAVGAERIGEGEAGPLYRVEVGFAESALDDSSAEGREGHWSIEAAVNALFEETISQVPRNRQREGVHLSGTLAEVGLPSLLGFIELERASGVLRLARDAQEAALFVREGRILDVESEIPGSSKQALGHLLGWSDGVFEFQFQPVERDDAIGQPTAALLLDLAQQFDEAPRQA